MPTDKGGPIERRLPPRNRFSFTVDDANAIGETSIFWGKRVELIGGQFIVRELGAPSHSGMVDRLGHLLHGAVGGTNIIRIQGPLRVSDVDLPEPDLFPETEPSAETES